MTTKTLFTLCFAFVATTIFMQAQTPLTGTWKRAELHVQTPDTNYVIADLPEGLFLFTGKHYSMMFLLLNQERPDISDYPDRQVPQGKAAALYRSFVAQSGSYEVDGPTMKLRPIVAKRPDVMDREVPNELEVEITKDAFWIIGKSPDGKAMSREKWVKVE